MVVMTVTEKEDYGNHGNYKRFEVTLTDKKQIDQSGW